MRERISPCRPRPTASGLTRARVRSRVKIESSKSCDARAGKMPAFRLLQCCCHRRAEIGWSLHAADAGGGHCGVLVPGGALASADDGAGVAHTAAWRRGLPGDEADDGLFHVGFDEFGGALFGVAPDFADE